MQEFIAKYGDKIEGVLSGFDRLIFRGTLRKIAHECGMKGYLWFEGRKKQIIVRDGFNISPQLDFIHFRRLVE